VKRSASFWFGLSAFIGLVSLGGVSVATAQTERPAASAQTPQSAAGSAASATPRRPRTTAAQRRAAATAREMADTVVPRYKVDASGDLVPDVRAAAAIILDASTGEVLWEENSLSQRSIASITKVMTALVVIEGDPDLTEQVRIVRGDVYRASTTLLRAGDRVTVEDLLHLLLIPSDNAAARALARVSPHGASGFIARMNEKAVELGLESTHYADPSGLLSDNVSSAYDMARLIALASSDPRIGSIMQKSGHAIQLPTRKIALRNTNHLIGREEFDVLAGKTGFIRRAGYCLATLLRLPQSGHEVAVVVLGARSNAGRFMETQNLLTWLSNKASTIFATTTPPQ
jgi:D-alanyl-D-alanine endopeptidase (penicillin-binding protein 7)